MCIRDSSWTVEKKKDSVSLNVHDILIIVIILRLLMTGLSFNGNDNHRWNQGINHDVIKCKAFSFLTRSWNLRRQSCNGEITNVDFTWAEKVSVLCYFNWLHRTEDTWLQFATCAAFHKNTVQKTVYSQVCLFVCFSNNLWLISSHKFIHMQTYFCNSASQKLSLKLQNLNAYTRSPVKQTQNFSMQKQKHLMDSVKACMCEVSKIAPAIDLVVQKWKTEIE